MVSYKRGILNVVLAGVLAMTSMAVSAFEYYVVNKDTSVFDAPGSSKSMSELYEGQMLLKIDGRDGWARVFFLNSEKQPLKGWLPQGFITPQGQPAGLDINADDYLMVNVDTLRIRKGPGADHGVVGALTRQQLVKPLASQGDWVQVQFTNAAGKRQVAWTARRYLKVATNDSIAVNSQPAPKPTPAAAPNRADTALFEVTGDQVRVRKGPGTQYRVDGKLSKGDTVQVLDSQNGWKKIRFGNGQKEGWTTARFLKQR